jgi:hypothetical protein
MMHNTERFMSRHLRFVVALFLFTVPVFATTFVVRDDRDLIGRSHAIVMGTALDSYPQWSEEGGVETLTIFSVTEVIKGKVSPTINIVEPGGSIDGMSTILSGVPHFERGEKALLFLRKIGADRWAVADLAVGKFSSVSDGRERLLQRDADEIAGWDAHLKPFVDRPRDETRFLHFIREVVAGHQDASENYFADRPLLRPRSQSTTVIPLIAPYTATSYTMFISGSLGGRWNVFPGSVTFFSGTQQEPGAPGGGVTAIQTAFTSWNNDCSSNVNYVYGGTDNGSHTQGLHGTDGANTILFERDLSYKGVAPFTCSGNSYGGVLGIGGITSATTATQTPPNVVNGETFATTLEGDVEMNVGIANCTLLFNNGDWNSAMTHEVGHTLGFRHSDQTRDSGGPCSGNSSLECTGQAIMNSFIPTGLNAALQAWDQHAVQAVYPGNVCAPGTGCTAPAITTQPSSPGAIVAGQSVTLSVAAAGTAPLSYQWYTGNSGNTASPVANGTGASVTVSPTTTTSYWVRVSNSCGSANSVTVTVTVTTNTPSAASKFFLVTACRIIDTRNANGPQGGPALGSGAKRTITVAGVCGLPTGVVAISANVAVIGPSGNGYLTLFTGPSSVPLPLASTINYQTGRTLANNAIVRAGSDSINVYNGGPTVHFVIDVNGYFK